MADNGNGRATSGMSGFIGGELASNMDSTARKGMTLHMGLLFRDILLPAAVLSWFKTTIRE